MTTTPILQLEPGSVGKVMGNVSANLSGFSGFIVAILGILLAFFVLKMIINSFQEAREALENENYIYEDLVNFSMKKGENIFPEYERLVQKNISSGIGRVEAERRASMELKAGIDFDPYEESERVRGAFRGKK